MCFVQEKAQLQEKADAMNEKLEMLMRLEAKLNEVMRLKKTELLRSQAGTGSLRDEAAGVEIKCAYY